MGTVVRKSPGHKLGSDYSWVTWRKVYDVNRPKSPEDFRNDTNDVSRSISRYVNKIALKKKKDYPVELK